MMYKVVLVDDEPSTALGLRDYFDWDSFGIEVAGVANDGITALPLIEQTAPDIVITDVRMPIMNGTSLADSLREKQLPVKIIFISGYDDTEYLRAALKNEAVDYLLKPIQFHELREVIGRTVEALRSERAEQRLLTEMERKLVQSMPLLREQFLQYLVRDSFPGAEALQSKLDFLDIRLPQEGLLGVFVVSIDEPYSSFLSLPEREQQLMSFAVLNICQETIDAHTRGHAFQSAPGQFVCILSLDAPEDEDDLYTLLSGMKANLERHLRWTFTFGVGPAVKRLLDVSSSYRQAAAAASRKLYVGNSRIIMMESLMLAPETQLLMDSGKAARFTETLRTASEEKLNRLFDDYFMQIQSMHAYTLQQCQQFCLHLVLLGTIVATELGVGADEIAQLENPMRDRLLHSETLQEMSGLLKVHFSIIYNFIQIKREVQSTQVAAKIKEIIHSGYQRSLSLSGIAEQVHLTTTYICMIFKQETGETINEYITGVRLDKAKELLRDHRNKLYQIGQAVGYPDPSYFTKLFKKHTGMTPGEFREAAL
ncbi:MAG: hypothetical protein K0R57_2709 [Paenibacillaceae bacterium]|jgi:two-component system response regulator YesN|nr:hypothetical protein [Paenibacillaceae bacterium]